jgi:hypothetical protein
VGEGILSLLRKSGVSGDLEQSFSVLHSAIEGDQSGLMVGLTV